MRGMRQCFCPTSAMTAFEWTILGRDPARASLFRSVIVLSNGPASGEFHRTCHRQADPLHCGRPWGGRANLSLVRSLPSGRRGSCRGPSLRESEMPATSARPAHPRLPGPTGGCQSTRAGTDIRSRIGSHHRAAEADPRDGGPTSEGSGPGRGGRFRRRNGRGALTPVPTMRQGGRSGSGLSLEGPHHG